MHCNHHCQCGGKLISQNIEILFDLILQHHYFNKHNFLTACSKKVLIWTTIYGLPVGCIHSTLNFEIFQNKFDYCCRVFFKELPKYKVV